MPLFGGKESGPQIWSRRFEARSLRSVGTHGIDRDVFPFSRSGFGLPPKPQTRPANGYRGLNAGTDFEPGRANEQRSLCTMLLLPLSAALVGSVTVGHCQPRIEYSTGSDDTVSSGCRTMLRWEVVWVIQSRRQDILIEITVKPFRQPTTDQRAK